MCVPCLFWLHNLFQFSVPNILTLTLEAVCVIKIMNWTSHTTLKKKQSISVFVLFFRWFLLGVANYFPAPLVLYFFVIIFKQSTNIPVTLNNFMGIRNWSPLFFSLLHTPYSLHSDCMILKLFFSFLLPLLLTHIIFVSEVRRKEWQEWLTNSCHLSSTSW